MMWDNIAEDNNCSMDCGSNTNVTLAAPTTMLMDADELCFYDDDGVTLQDAVGVASPELLGLLSPEGSPQRFQIMPIANAAVLLSHQKLLQQQQQQQALALSGQATPARSFRVFNSLSSTGSMESSMDDEYMELFEMESLAGQQQQMQQQTTLLQQRESTQNNYGFPSGLNSLISGQIKVVKSPSAVQRNTEGVMMRRPSARRCLSLTETHSNQQEKQPKTQELQQLLKETARDCFKRPEPPVSASCSPVQIKRHRCAEKENCPNTISSIRAVSAPANANGHEPNANGQIQPPPLRKCMSLNEAEIASALARSDNRNEPELIGDFSKAYALPLIDGRHQDLKSISSSTVARLLRGDFDHEVANYRIIDCRYPYEFEGGHIAGAKNLYTHEQILEEFLTPQQTERQQEQNSLSGQKRNIIIFHCEFSSERGPKMSRFLRNLDRERNTNFYPALHYPEIYLLHNGYKEFYETHAELCEPHAYCPMLEPAYSDALRHFRAKSKSWNGDGLGGTTGRLKKSRSRLML